MSAYEMVSSNRSEINIVHHDGNDYTISAHRPGDEEPSEIYLTRAADAEVARMLVDYVAADDTAAWPRRQTIGSSSRKYLARCRTICAMTCPIRRWPVAGHGVIAALPSRGKIEWRMIDLDAGSSEPIGGRIYRASPAVAAQWMLGNLVSSQRATAIDDVIAIRDAAAKIINAKLNGEQEANRLTALIRNAFIEHWEREGEDLTGHQDAGDAAERPGPGQPVL